MTRAVITFHGIDDSGSVLSYPQSSLVAMLEGLRRAAVPIVPLDALLRLESGVTLTFDDGMASVLTQALPVLQSYAAPAHLFVVSDYVGATNRIFTVTNAQISHGGIYHVVVSNAFGAIRSSNATLTVISAPSPCRAPSATSSVLARFPSSPLAKSIHGPATGMYRS